MSGQYPFKNPPPGHQDPADEFKTARELAAGQEYQLPHMQQHNRPLQTAAAHNATVFARMAHRDVVDPFMGYQPVQAVQQAVNFEGPNQPNQFTELSAPNVNEANPGFTSDESLEVDSDEEQAADASPGGLQEPATPGQQSSPNNPTAINMTSSSNSSRPAPIPLEFDSLARYVHLRSQGDIPSVAGNDDFNEVRQGLASDVREMMEMFQQDLNINLNVKPFFGPAKTDWNVQKTIRKKLEDIQGVTDRDHPGFNQLERALWELMQQLINLHDPSVQTGRTKLLQSYTFNPKLKCSERLAEIKANMNTCPKVRENALQGKNLVVIVKCAGMVKKRYDDNKKINAKRKAQKEALKAKAAELEQMKAAAGTGVDAGAGTKRKQSARQKTARPNKKSKGAGRKRQETPEDDDELSDQYGRDSDDDADGSDDPDFA